MPRWNHKSTQVAVSQPLPIPPLEEWMSRSFIIGDFGSAQFVDNQVTDEITPFGLRAPETILRLPWDEKVDIWTFGCLVFEFLALQSLMKPTPEGFHPDKMALLQMLVYTEERLPAETIRSSPFADAYLNAETGWLKDDPPPIKRDFVEILKKVNSVPKIEDIIGGAALIKKCHRLDPKNRPSAKHLLEDPWLNSE